MWGSVLPTRITVKRFPETSPSSTREPICQAASTKPFRAKSLSTTTYKPRPPELYHQGNILPIMPNMEKKSVHFIVMLVLALAALLGYAQLNIPGAVPTAKKVAPA